MSFRRILLIAFAILNLLAFAKDFDGRFRKRSRLGMKQQVAGGIENKNRSLPR